MLSLKAYRRAAVPLLAVHTADPAEVVRLAVREATNGTIRPVLVWDCIHGLREANKEGVALTDAANEGQNPAIATGNPVEFLRAVEQLGNSPSAEKSIIVAIGLADAMVDASSGYPTRQALWNLRDKLTSSGILLVLAVPMGWRNPFPDDIAMVESPLPNGEAIRGLVGKICGDAKITEPGSEATAGLVDALTGLSGFACEQALALSLTKKGFDVESLWDRKRMQISETPGLSVYAGKERFDDLGGLAQAKRLYGAVLAGKRKPGAIVFVDEVEKSLAGSAGDTSGVSQSILGYLLSYMQDQEATGSIFIGPPGAAKSAFAKAIGNEGGIPTVTLDLGGIKGSLVGESESRMRSALAVITAVSGGRPFFVATCNSIGALPPELRRRFTVGTMFFDLPSAEERKTIWGIYVRKYRLTGQEIPSAEGWTGAEIKQCCFAPHHRLLGTDLRWKNADTFTVGDVVLGFDENGPYRDFREATIEAMSFADEPTLDIQLESGHSFRVTYDHRVLSRSIAKESRWVFAIDLRGGELLPRLLHSWDDDQSRDAGWLAGILDGEGFYSRRNGLTIGQKPGVVLNKIEYLLHQYGVSYSRRQTNKGRLVCTCQTIRINGGQPQLFELLGRIRPERLLSHIRFSELGRMEARLGYDRVISVTPSGIHNIIKITTSTATLVVDGYPHHNCDLADRLSVPLVDAARFVVPVSVSAWERIENLRREASGRYLSASAEGVYVYKEREVRRAL